MWDLKDHLMFEITVCLTDRMITTFHFDNELVKNRVVPKLKYFNCFFHVLVKQSCSESEMLQLFRVNLMFVLFHLSIDIGKLI